MHLSSDSLTVMSSKVHRHPVLLSPSLRVLPFPPPFGDGCSIQGQKEVQLQKKKNNQKTRADLFSVPLPQFVLPLIICCVPGAALSSCHFSNSFVLTTSL